MRFLEDHNLLPLKALHDYPALGGRLGRVGGNQPPSVPRDDLDVVGDRLVVPNFVGKVADGEVHDQVAPSHNPVSGKGVSWISSHRA